MTVRFDLENNVLILLSPKHICWPTVLVPTGLLVPCLSLSLRSHLGVQSGIVSLLLVCDLLQPVELLSVQLVELGVDVCRPDQLSSHTLYSDRPTFDGVLCPRNDDMLDGIHYEEVSLGALRRSTNTNLFG